VQPTLLFTDTVENEIARMTARYGKRLRLELHPYVYAYASRGLINNLRRRWQWQYGVQVRENQSIGMLEMRFRDGKGNVLPVSEEPEKNTDSKE